MITIITAIKNGEKHINGLITSLNNQTSKDFKWLVIDGMSTDNSIDFINDKSEFSFKIFSQLDFSIYHALNIGITKVDTLYYCVAGCDDKFSNTFIEDFYSIIENEKYDLILGTVMSNGNLIRPFLKNIFISPVNASHSIGTIIRTDIHRSLGLYSNMYPIVADKKLVMDIQLISNKIHFTDKVFGEYSQEGFSSLNSIDYIFDLFKLQIKYKRNFIFQFILFFFRFLKILIKKILS
jgi:glycosyltransferase involved in cell wall biosynthesis